MKKMSAVEACLRRPDKSVRARGVHIDTNDDTARIYPGSLSEENGGAGVVERRENAIVQQKSMIAVCRADPTSVVYPDDVVLGVTTSNKGAIQGAWKINRGVLSILQQVAVSQFTDSICVITDDCTRRAHSGGRAVGCAGWIEEGVVAFFGNYKTVGSDTIAREAAGRVGTGES
jgi:hypothetical protein